VSCHHDIRPVERDCICLERTLDGPHIAQCNAQFRAKFFTSWSTVRNDFYAEAASGRLLAVPSGALLN